MTEDLRVCPHCKHYPPDNKVWADFDGHKRRCLARQKNKADLRVLQEVADVSNLFKRVLNGLD